MYALKKDLEKLLKYIRGKISPSSESPIKVYKIWAGTQVEYDAIAIKDSNTLYHITE